ncbi:SGNH/GDSL hydrolase family protein [Thalassotalea crassostreae]|uniref:SGNH/GDSL hydrolase family protein n=1 Tax=Thalassotalea crassostreae TaxID=1763536 RepID=UPI000838F344|nr:SGNH/GDSL hydrolase family protein [Thalassotalea crassostreae]
MLKSTNISKQLKLLLSSMIVLAVVTSSPSNAAQQVNLNDDKIRFLGASYIYQQDNQVSFTRHSKKILALPNVQLGFNPIKAQTTSGIAINLATNSSEINFEFIIIEKENRGSEFALYENNKLVKTFKFQRKDKTLKLSYQSKNSKYKEYRLTLPSWSNVALQSISLDDNSKLLTIKSPRQAKYVAMGDSITHGVGQGSATHLTYPYIVSQHLDLELFNLAVGGGKTSIPTANMLAEFDEIELITLLIGYNDWNSPKADVKQYQQNLENMLEIIRSNHPETKIYCITPLFTKSKKAKHVSQPLDAYRQAVINVVSARIDAGDRNIEVIKGDSITSIDNLRQDSPKDPVHLGVAGAQMLADQLIQIIKSHN